MLQVTGFKCEWCAKKIYMHKSSCKRHEKICWYNPESKSCLTCNRNKYNCLGLTDDIETNCKNWQKRTEEPINIEWDGE